MHADEGPGDLPYQSLYRRYRPQRFSEVRGQDHVVLALRNAARDGRIGHAYLLSGPRGTGKTSTARILAKALNCASPVGGEPCGTCESCVAISKGASLDVHELDAASNNRVDDMRDLVARASLASPGKWKVYIVDEVHMLSTAASNALLKTLEDPPEAVVFVLATTDPQKVLPTIRSRTQHYEFHLFEPEVLHGLVSDIAADAKLDVPEEGLTAAVKRGHGSARDAISALDQVVAGGMVDDDDRFVRSIIDAIAEQDSGAALTSVEEAFVAGFDARRLGDDLIAGLRGIFLAAVAPQAVCQPGVLSSSLGPARSVRAMELLGTAMVDMREALEPRTTLEVALVRLTRPDLDESTAALVDRLERLEARVRELAEVAAGAAPAADGKRPSQLSPSSDDPPTPSGVVPLSRSVDSRAGSAAPAVTPAGPEKRGAGAGQVPAGVEERRAAGSADGEPGVGSDGDAGGTMPTRDEVVTAWADHVLARLRSRPRAVYAICRFTAVEGDEVVVAFPNAAHVEHALPLAEEVGDALGSHFGCRLRLRLNVDEAAGAEGTRPRRSRGGDERRQGAGDGDPAPTSRVAQDLEARESAGEDDSSDAFGPADGAGAAVMDAKDTQSWAQSRLLAEFPGAEEVS